MVTLGLHASDHHPGPPRNHLPRPTTQEFPPLLDRATYLAHRHLDAERGPRLAHASPYLLRPHAGSARLHAVPPGAPALPLGRGDRRLDGQAEASSHHSVGVWYTGGVARDGGLDR